MTAADMPSAIFTGTPKLIAVGADETLLDVLREKLEFAVIRLRESTDGALLAATPEAEVALGAPPAGLTVIGHTAAARPQADALAGLWRAAGLAEPPRITLPENGDDHAAPQAAISAANAFALAAVAAHKEACTEAVLLDRQIAALREQLEDSRNKWQDCASALRDATHDIPMLGYATRDFSGRLKMSRDSVLSQQLPYAGIYCKAAAIHIAAPASGEGRLECRLMAQEDDVELARWERVAANREGWQVLELPADIPWRYRNLRLVMIWHGEDTGSPEVSLARAAGMDRHFLQINATPRDGTRLALRAWTGHPDSPPPAGGTEPSALQPQTIRGLGQSVDTALLEEHVELVDRSLGQWPWVSVSKGAVMVHPTLTGPSIIGLTLTGSAGLRGLCVTAETPNENAPPIAFLAAAYPGSVTLSLDSGAADPLPRDTALACDGWQELPPGSSMPLKLTFPPQQDPVQLVLATRVPGRSVDNAHAWFRDIRMVFEP